MKLLAQITLLLPIAIGLFLPTLVSHAQTQPENFVLQPVPNYRDRNPADEDISSCFSDGALAGITSGTQCGNVVTAADIEFRSTHRGLTLREGDSLRCIVENRYSFAAGYSVVCTATHPDGTADSAAEANLTSGGGLIVSSTDASGNTTAGQGSDNIVERGTEAVGEAIGGAASDVVTRALQTVGIAILGISTFLLGMAGVFFNLVVVKTVFGFATLIGNAPGLLVAWGVLRDLGNMLLLFGFIFIGLATILDLQTYSAKKALPRLLIFAILMNFSLFAAEAVIDVSNVLSSTLYAQANTDPCLGESEGTIAVSGSGGGFDGATDELKESCLLNYGLAGAIMEASGLSTMFQLPDDASFSSVAVYIGLSLFATIGAVVFFAGGIMLVVRALILTILMITAPIGFAAMALPPLKKFGDEWWSKLIHQAFFAPILILLILVSIKVSESFAGGNENGLAGALTQPNSSAMGVILVFSLVIGLLISSLMAAKKFGAMGADFAISSSKKFVNAPFSFAGRNTIGRGGAWGQKKYETWMGKSGSQQSRGGKAARFLLRNNVLGLDAAVAGTTAKAQKAKFGGSTSFDESKKRREERDKTFKGAREKADAEERKATNKKNLDDALASGQDSKIADVLQSMSDKDRDELDVMKKSEQQLEIIARNLSPEHFDKMMNNKDTSDDKKDKMRNARFSNLSEKLDAAKSSEDALAANPADPTLKAARDAAVKKARDATRELTSKDISQLAQSTKYASKFSDGSFTSLFTDDQFKDLKKNTGLGVQQRRDAQTSRDANLKTYTASTIASMNAEAVGKLPAEVLSDAAVLNQMSGRQLAAIDPDKLNPTQLRDVVTFISDQTRRNTPAGDEFSNLFIANPKINQKWSGLV